MIGRLISKRYEVVRPIGQGGMQDVFLAMDRLLKVEVALKTPLAGQPNARFSKSAKIAAKINHHNVAKTLDYVEEDGNLYLIEEYVPGETLEKKLTRYGLIDPHLGASVFYHLLKGLAASHHVGVIHRDIKPSNVMVSDGPNLDHLKITDFGIATLTEEVFEQAAKDGDLTRSTSGTIRGALPYMAPELMFRADNTAVDTPADIWSLGAMMFRVLTGIYPFGVYLEAAVNVRNGNRASWPDFMTRNEQYAPLSKKIQSLVDSCLSIDPTLRPTADEILAEFENVCYISAPRYEASVYRMIQNGYSGFASGEGGNVFFSRESVYGPKKAVLNSKIYYAKFPGSPESRAHPLMVIG